MSVALVRPTRRTILLLDAVAVVWVVAWFVAGVALAREVAELTELTTTVEVAAGAIEETGGALGVVGNVPFVGGRVRELAERIEQTGVGARRSAVESRESVESLSRALGAAVALIPSLLLLALYVPLRVLWHRDAARIERALRRDPADPLLREYLARRAVATLPYAELRRVSESPWRDLEEGRHEALAGAELARLGLRAPQTRA